MISLSWRRACAFQESEANYGSYFNIFEHKNTVGYFLIPTNILGYEAARVKPINSVKTKTFKLKIVK